MMKCPSSGSIRHRFLCRHRTSGDCPKPPEPAEVARKRSSVLRNSNSAASVCISDPDAEQPVFNDMRQNLQALGTLVADIRTATRITPHV